MTALVHNLAPMKPFKNNFITTCMAGTVHAQLFDMELVAVVLLAVSVPWSHSAPAVVERPVYSLYSKYYGPWIVILFWIIPRFSIAESFNSRVELCLRPHFGHPSVLGDNDSTSDALNAPGHIFWVRSHSQCLDRAGSGRAEYCNTHSGTSE